MRPWGYGMRLKVLTLLVAAAIAPVSIAHAGFETNHVEISTPTSAWLVGPSLVNDSEATRGLHIPCIMVNQFNSGHTIRISAGGEKVYAIAIDYRQRLFNKAEMYDVEIGVGSNFDASVSAMAYNTDTLLIGMQDFPDFYEALKVNKMMFIKQGDNVVDLALVGVSQGLDRVEACYSETAQRGQTQAVAAPLTEDELGDITPMPDLIPDTALPSTEKPKVELPTDLPQVAPENPHVEQQVAEHQKEVEALIDDLLQVSEDKPVVQVPEGARVAKSGPVAVTGGRLANTWAAPDMPQTVPAPLKPPVAANQSRTWRAIRGTSLREIVDVWALKENVRVIWMAGDEFTIRKSMSVQGKFEEAISSLLNQFGEEKTRPVGKIYIDPQFNQKVLLVESKRDY